MDWCFEAAELDINNSFSEKSTEEKKCHRHKENGEEMKNKLGWWNVTVQPFSELLQAAIRI